MIRQKFLGFIPRLLFVVLFWQFAPYRGLAQEIKKYQEFSGVEALLSEADTKKLKKPQTLRETAYLYIEAIPSNAEIYIDGTKEGVGVVSLKLMGPRYRLISVSAAGHEMVEGYVELREREVTKFRIRLEPKGGKLTVLTDPYGAEVMLDNQRVGSTPITLKGLTVGPHHLSLQSGSWSWAGTVTVSASETNIISMQMGSAVSVNPSPPPPPPPKVEPSPQSSPQPELVSTPVSKPQVTQPASTPSQQEPQLVQEEKQPKPDCKKVCEKFVSIVEGSPSIKDPIKAKCLSRCESGDVRFSVCAWKAKTMADVGVCGALPPQK